MSVKSTTMDVSALLEDFAAKLMCFGNYMLDTVAYEFWPEFAAAVQTAPFPLQNKTLAKRRVAALFASRVYLQLGRLPECMRYALAASDLFDSADGDAYAAAIVAQCVDRYATRATDPPSEDAARLLDAVDRLFDRCSLEDGRDRWLLLRLALRARRMDVVVGCMSVPSDANGGNEDCDLLPYATRAAIIHVDHSGFRDTVLRGLIELHVGCTTTMADRVSLILCYVFLDDPESAAQFLRRSVQANDVEENVPTVYRLACELYESASQWFLACVIDSLEQTIHACAALSVLKMTQHGTGQDHHHTSQTVAVVSLTNAVSDTLQSNTESPHPTQSDDEFSTLENLIKILSGEIIIKQNLLFLTENNSADMSILNNTKKAISTSSCETATMIANGFMFSGTANDNFLRKCTLLAKWNSWDLFSAVVSLGVIHKGHETNALRVINSYLCLIKTNPLESSEYSEGGGLYALGLIYVNHGAAINDYLLSRLKDEHNQIVKHGGCLAIGLSAIGTRRADIYEQLKTIMYQDNAGFGEAVGIAMGLVMLGSKKSESLQDMVTYARLIQHERVLRGLAVGISFFMYGRLEEADQLISSLLQDKNPILRCSAMYTISMAFCGTGNNTAVKKLLHTANSDVSDEVRCAAVTSLGFLLFRIPEKFLQIISTLTKSYNPYVRYGAAMALGIACAGTGHKEAIDLLKPMIYDLVNYVRQGALIASALIYVHQTESTCYKMKYFRSMYSKLISENDVDDVVKFGAILAQGIIDSGGHNVSISLGSKTGYLNTLTVVGLLLFTQYKYCNCLAHCLTLAFKPVCTTGFNTKLKIPTFEWKNSYKIKHEVCFSALCLNLAKKRGWIEYLFNQNKPKLSILERRQKELENFAYRILIPKIARDIQIIKSNWSTGHFFIQKINCNSENLKGVNCVQYDSDKIVSGLCDHSIRIWNKYTLKCIKVLIGHTGSVQCLQFDEKVIISGSNDTTVRVWNILTGEMVNILTYHSEAVLHLRFSDNIMVTCSKDFSVAIWNILSPNEITLHCILIDHQGEVNVVDFDKKYIVTGLKDYTIRVWNTSSCDFVRALVGHIHGITCLQYKERLVVSGSSDNTIRLWDIEYGVCLRILEVCEGIVVCIKFDSKIIVSGTSDGKIKVWNLEATLDPSAPESNLCLRTFKEHKDIVNDLQFDKFQIISCSKDDTILLWDFLNHN